MRINLAGLHTRTRVGRFLRRRKRLIAVTTALAVVLGGSLGADGAADATNDAVRPSVSIHGTTKICGKDAHIVTVTRVDVRNNNFRGEPMCLTVWPRMPNFQITASGLNEPWAAFPNAFVGCEVSVCSPHSPMPIQIRNIRQAHSSWHYHPGGPWTGNAAYDIWFNPTRMTLGQVNHGAEIMIWLNQNGIGEPGGTGAYIDGTQWAYTHWVAKHGRLTWNYIRFWRLSRTLSVKNLNLKSFIGYAEAKHLLSSTWWLTSVESGYELWRGGVGMHTLWYSVDVKPWHAPSTPARKPTPEPTLIATTPVPRPSAPSGYAPHSH